MNEDSDKTYKVYRLKDGTVIDHIPRGKALKVMKVLNLDKDKEKFITCGMNLTSKKYGFKDIVKIEHRELSGDDVNKISLVAPTATLNILREGKVIKKNKVSIPHEMNGLIKCPNPSCITNNDLIKTKFYFISKEPLKVRCHYCERFIEEKDISLL